MKAIVITGSTRGIGFGLAQAFLKRSCAVMISGRSQSSVHAALEKLQNEFPEPNLLGHICDVRDPGQVQALWDRATDAWGKVDIWINNAGISGSEASIWDLPPEETAAVIDTNILGTIYGCQVAARGMLKQGSGAIYNMEGMGSDGRIHSGLITALLTDQYRDRPEEFERVKSIFNIIAERVEKVTPWLAEHMLANTKSGVVLSFSNRWKLTWRFLTAPFNKRDLFTDL